MSAEGSSQILNEILKPFPIMFSQNQTRPFGEGRRERRREVWEISNSSFSSHHIVIKPFPLLYTSHKYPPLCLFCLLWFLLFCLLSSCLLVCTVVEDILHFVPSFISSSYNCVSLLSYLYLTVTFKYFPLFLFSLFLFAQRWWVILEEQWHWMRLNFLFLLAFNFTIDFNSYILFVQVNIYSRYRGLFTFFLKNCYYCIPIVVLELKSSTV